jgi:phosphohistidine phosphatase
MKKLFLVRHAKSSWDYPGLTDFERPLSKRGHRDAPIMGKKLKEKNIIPDLIISSPATRAITTARYFAESMDYPMENINIDERLYEAGPADIIAVISDVDDSVHSLMLISHNPGLMEAADQLTGKVIENIVTSAIFSIEFDTDSWKNISKKNAGIGFYEYPKKHI